MKANKGFLLLDLAVVFLVVGTLLFFVSGSFRSCAHKLNFANDVRKAQVLAEQALVTENVDVPEHWQLNKLEHVVQGRNLLEVQVVEKSSGRIIFNLWWMP